MTQRKLIVDRNNPTIHKQINRTTLIDELANQNPKFSKQDLKQLLDQLFEYINEHVYQGDKILIRNFGAFIPRKVVSPAHKLENYNKKEKAEPSMTIRFKPSRTVRTEFNHHISRKKKIK